MRQFILAGLALALGAATAAAQGKFPERPITVVIPSPPGGPNDLITRLAQPKLLAVWGQPAVVENRPGASGTIGAYSVARAEPDGYTVLLTVDIPITMAPGLMTVPYDPRKDFAIVGMFGEGMQMLVVHPSLGVKSVPELLAKAKAEPGKLAFSSAGNGSPGHICGEMLNQMGGVQMLHVPYRGAAPAAQALVANEVQVFCGVVTQTAPLATGGKAVALAAAGATRSVMAPDVPTFMEQGMKEFVMTNWYAVMAPPKTPEPVMAVLRNGFRQAFADPELKSRVAAAGIDLYWKDAAEGLAMIDRDLEKWGKVIKAGNIKAD